MRRISTVPISRCYLLNNFGSSRSSLHMVRPSAPLLLSYHKYRSFAVQAPLREESSVSYSKASRDMLENAAALGDSMAMFYLGRLYERGQEGKGIDDAVALYRESASRGNVHAHYILGCHQMRAGRSLAEALLHFEEGAKQAHPPSLCNLGMIYLRGSPDGTIKPDSVKGRTFLEHAVSLGHPHAAVELGVLLLRSPQTTDDGQESAEFARAMELFIGAAEKGDLDAIFHLATIYEQSEDKQTDRGESLENPRSLQLYESAAQAGHAPSQAQLAKIYLDGQGVPRDLKKAISLLQGAVKQDHPMALCELGFLMENGQGMERNLEDARQLFERAAELGYAPALCHLGSLYYDGHGLEKDLKKAHRYYRLSAKQEFPPAYYMLGVMAESGFGGRSGDVERARKYFLKAARRGHAQALCDLGRMYSKGIGVEKNEQKAELFFRRSASRGCSLGYVHLGLLKEYAALPEVAGESEESRKERQNKQWKQAYRFYRAAALMRDVEAHYRLASMLAQGKGVKADPEQAKAWLERALAITTTKRKQEN